jgi:hypothetical protein
MFKMIITIKKAAMAALILAIAGAAFPITGASGAGLDGQTDDRPGKNRLERTWVREQRIYQRDERQLARADGFISKVQNGINKANEKGWDTLSLQAALDVFSAAIPVARAAHEPGAAIIAVHAGFDENGKVIDQESAVDTAKSLGKVLKGTRAAMNGTRKALFEALKSFRDAHPRTIPTTGP